MKNFLIFATFGLLAGFIPNLYAQQQFQCLLPPQNQPINAASSTAQSYYGGNLTPKGDLHLLVIFVQYTDNYLSNTPNIDSLGLFPLPANWGHDPSISDSTLQEQWSEDSLPSIAQHFPSYPLGQNRLFNATLPIGGAGQVHNMSEYYYEQSGGQFEVTADMYPVVVPVSYFATYDSNFFTRQFNVTDNRQPDTNCFSKKS